MTIFMVGILFVVAATTASVRSGPGAMACVFPLLFRKTLPNTGARVKPAFPSAAVPLASLRMRDRPQNNRGQDYPRIRPGDDGWQRTLWAMVGIQFVMTAAINFLSPIIPLMLPQLGVETVEGVD